MVSMVHVHGALRAFWHFTLAGLVTITHVHVLAHCSCWIITPAPSSSTLEGERTVASFGAAVSTGICLGNVCCRNNIE
eukprot:COSAG01_NODE_33702_length_560_cov_0.902386_1_plen_77_part_10